MRNTLAQVLFREGVQRSPKDSRLSWALNDALLGQFAVVLLYPEFIWFRGKLNKVNCNFLQDAEYSLRCVLQAG